MNYQRLTFISSGALPKITVTIHPSPFRSLRKRTKETKEIRWLGFQSFANCYFCRLAADNKWLIVNRLTGVRDYAAAAAVTVIEYWLTGVSDSAAAAAVSVIECWLTGVSDSAAAAVASVIECWLTGVSDSAAAVAVSVIEYWLTGAVDFDKPVETTKKTLRTCKLYDNDPLRKGFSFILWIRQYWKLLIKKAQQETAQPLRNVPSEPAVVLYINANVFLHKMGKPCRPGISTGKKLVEKDDSAPK